MSSKAVALTTSDNPHDYFTEYEKWREYDTVLHDYDTECYLDRVAQVNKNFGDELYDIDSEFAIDEAVKLNIISYIYDGVSYKKVEKEE